MSLPVRLKDVIDAMEPLNDDWQAFIHRNTGELVSFSAEEALQAEGEGKDEDEDEHEMDGPQYAKIREAFSSADFVQLPGAMDFDEYSVMEDFCFTVQEPDLQKRLLEAIRGSGAFRRFKQLTRSAGVEERWFEHRDRALQELAREFLEQADIPFHDV
jgi:hypothetical protein